MSTVFEEIRSFLWAMRYARKEMSFGWYWKKEERYPSGYYTFYYDGPLHAIWIGPLHISWIG